MSMTLILVSLNWSRRHMAKTFRAALEVEYAVKVAAGKTPRPEPVLHCQHRISLDLDCTVHTR